MMAAARSTRSVRYKITHRTRYSYSEPVPFCQNLVYLTPRNTDRQRCLRHRLIVRPEPATQHRQLDYFGNQAHIFSIDKTHRQLQVVTSSTVELTSRRLPDKQATAAWNQVAETLAEPGIAAVPMDYQFAFRSPLVPLYEELRNYAAESFPPGRPILDALEELNRRIHNDFRYDPEATTVNTPVTEVFRARSGVCQDLAHLMLGCLRPLGLAARYVSGYLRTIPPPGQPRLVGADASHAWVSVHCGEAGWIDVDPTNNRFPDTDHVTVAWGRDYGDVCPVAGMFIGGGTHELAVSVDVVPLTAKG